MRNDYFFISITAQFSIVEPDKISSVRDSILVL